MSINGSNQAVRIINGVDKGSKKNIREKFILFSSFCHSSDKVRKLIRKL